MKKALFLCALLCCFQSTILAQQSLTITGLQLLHVEDLEYRHIDFKPSKIYIKALVQGPDGYRYIALMEDDMMTDNIVKDNGRGDSSVVVGKVHLPGGPHITAPALLTVDKDKNLYYFNSSAEGSGIRKLSPQGVNTFYVATTASGEGGMAFDRDGNIYTTDFWNGKLYKIDRQGSQTLVYNDLDFPAGVAFDEEGNLFLINNYNVETTEILKVSPQGYRSVFASFPNTSFLYLQFDAAKNLIVSGNYSAYSITPSGEVRLLGNNFGYVSGATLDERANLVLAVMEGGSTRDGIYTLERIVKISEHLAEGTKLAQLSAATTSTGTLTFSIAAGNESGAYALDPVTGILRVANAAALDFETTPSQTLLLQVSDGQTTATEALTIYLIDQEETSEPLLTVETLEIREITATSATVLGEVQAEGIEIRQKGVVYATTPMPELGAADVFEAGTGAGAFSATLENLSPATLYYVRAYAQSSQGLSYGEARSFTTEEVVFAPEPVEVINLQATILTKQVQLQWQTADVYEELLFDIERSKDGDSFAVIGQVVESSPEMELKGFSFLDTAPLKGQAYYRLKIHQAYGESTYSAIVSTKSSGSKGGKGKSANTLEAWPNPVDQQRTTLASDDFQPLESLHIRLFNATGKLVMESRGQVQENGTLPLLLPPGLKKGIHLLQVNGLSGIYTLQLIIN